MGQLAQSVVQMVSLLGSVHTWPPQPAQLATHARGLLVVHRKVVPGQALHALTQARAPTAGMH